MPFPPRSTIGEWLQPTKRPLKFKPFAPGCAPPN
jgi:hypothetical protein